MLEAVSRSRGFFWIRPADAGGDAWSLHAILDRLAHYAGNCWLLGTVSSKKLLEWEEIAGSDALCRAIFPVMFLFY